MSASLYARQPTVQEIKPPGTLMYLLVDPDFGLEAYEARVPGRSVPHRKIGGSEDMTP